MVFLNLNVFPITCITLLVQSLQFEILLEQFLWFGFFYITAEGKCWRDNFIIHCVPL